MEEHLAEGALYAAGKSGKVNVHFTVSTEHRELFKKLVAEKVDEFSKRYGVDYYITFSEQKPSTDTIAADLDNHPFPSRWPRRTDLEPERPRCRHNLHQEHRQCSARQTESRHRYL